MLRLILAALAVAVSTGGVAAHNVLATPSTGHANYQINVDFKGPYVVSPNSTNTFRSSHSVLISPHQACQILVYGRLYLDGENKTHEFGQVTEENVTWSEVLEWESGVPANGKATTGTQMLGGSTPYDPNFIEEDPHNIVWIL
jgi:hypothetical protein